MFCWGWSPDDVEGGTRRRRDGQSSGDGRRGVVVGKRRVALHHGAGNVDGETGDRTPVNVVRRPDVLDE